MQKTKVQPRGAVEKIRQFRTDFYKDYMKRHKKFDMHGFTVELLKRKITRR